MRDLLIEQLFPNIGQDYRLTSPQDTEHNCIAYAAGDTENWWWPNRYWPDGVPRQHNLQSFILAYESLGYKHCSLKSKYQKGYERVAVFVDRNGLPTHAAWQPENLKGLWKSKLGEHYDIEHTIHGLSGHFHIGSYGEVAAILKRRCGKLPWYMQVLELFRRLK